MSRSVRHARCERSAHCLRDFLKRRTTHSSPQRRCVQSRADRGAATSGGPVSAISVRSACSSIGWSSSVVLSCWGDSHRAIDERSRRAHPIVSFDRRFVCLVYSFSNFGSRFERILRGFVCCACRDDSGSGKARALWVRGSERDITWGRQVTWPRGPTIRPFGYFFFKEPSAAALQGSAGRFISALAGPSYWHGAGV